MSNEYLRRFTLIIYFGSTVSFRSRIIFIISLLRRLARCPRLEFLQVIFRVPHSTNPWCELREQETAKDRARVRQQLTVYCETAAHIRTVLSTMESGQILVEVVEGYSGFRIGKPRL